MSATSSSGVAALSRDHLAWPFFDAGHADFAARLDAFAASDAMASVDHHDVDGACRKLVKALGEAGCSPPPSALMVARGSTAARSALRAKHLPSTMASPISPSPCRA